MSTHTNGTKTFLYVIRHDRCRIGECHHCETYLIHADRDPEAEELVALLSLDYDEMHDELEAIRYDPEAVPTLPPRKVTL